MPTSPLKPSVLMVSTSFPLRHGAVSGNFVKQLAESIAKETQLKVLSPAGKSVQTFFPDEYSLISFSYAPQSLQKLTHEPGGIPAALKKSRIYWIAVPLLLGAMFFNVLKQSKNHQLIHSNWAITGVICGLVGLITKTPCILTLRGSDVSGYQKSWIKRFVLSLAIRLSDAVVTVSATMKHDLKRSLPIADGKIHFIPNGVSDNFFLPARTPPRQPKLIFIGNLVANKGCDIALEALARTQSACLTVVGDGPELEALITRCTRLNLGDRVTFLGRQPPDRIPWLLSEHDILLFPSWEEGRPNVVLESMAAGKAILASHLPVLDELIIDGVSGLFFQPGNFTELASLIERTYSDQKLMSTLGLAAKNKIIDSNLTWDATSHEYLSIYRKIINTDI